MAHESAYLGMVGDRMLSGVVSPLPLIAGMVLDEHYLKRDVYRYAVNRVGMPHRLVPRM